MPHIIVTYVSIDRARMRRSFATLAGAQRFAARMVGATPEIGSSYAVSGDGIGRVRCLGATLAELFPAAVEEPTEPVYRDTGLALGPEFADEVSIEERWAHYAFEERHGMPYGSSF